LLSAFYLFLFVNTISLFNGCAFIFLIHKTINGVITIVDPNQANKLNLIVLFTTAKAVNDLIIAPVIFAMCCFNQNNLEIFFSTMRL